MTMKFKFEALKKGQSVILPIAKAAILMLPLLSALPPVAQIATQGQIISVRVYAPAHDTTNKKGYSEMKKTTEKKMLSGAAALDTSLQTHGSDTVGMDRQLDSLSTIPDLPKDTLWK